MNKNIIAVLADDTHPGGKITLQEWGGNLMIVRKADIITLRPAVEQALLAALQERQATHTITVTVPATSMSDRELESVDDAIDALAALSKVTVRGWGDQ